MYDCDGVPCPTGVFIHYIYDDFFFDYTMTDGSTFSLKLTATWTVGVLYPQVYTYSKVINM